jgi:SAM-dependent methyltransferase
MEETIVRDSDVFEMLDRLLRDEPAFWDGFYGDRSREAPFFADVPDENLVELIRADEGETGRAIDIGCGFGRNALFLARQGWAVDAVDLSPVAVARAEERAAGAGLNVSFHCGSVMSLKLEAAGYDLVYDSGCLHHIPPHRRPAYLRLVRRLLKPGGRFGLVCFNTEGGSDLSDWEVYRVRSLRGGLGFSERRLRQVLAPHFEVVELRTMNEAPAGAPVFGKAFLWAALLRSRPSAEG